MANRIPHNAKVLDVTYKVGDYGHMVVEKNEFGEWIGTDDNGKRWSIFASHLRNSDIMDVEVIE